MIEEIKEDNNCIIKAFENNPIVILHENINNKKVYYFKALDIGKALDLTNIRASIQNYDEDEQVVREVYDLRGCKQNTTFLSSQGVYRLLYNSKKELAKKFRKWAGNILDDIIFNESTELKRQLQEQLKITQETKSQLDIKDNEHIQNLKLSKQEILLEKFKNKPCIYLSEVGENLIKCGSSQDANIRKGNLKSIFGHCIFLDIFECTLYNFREIEQHILYRVKNYLYKEPINGHISKEVVKLNDQTFNYKQLLKIVTYEINNYYNKEQELIRLDVESKKLDLINKLTDKNFTFEQIFKLVNYQTNQTEIKEQINNESIIISNTIIKRGRKIQVINPDNLNIIVKIYDSMIFALRDSTTDYDKNCIQKAIKNNTIYKGYRWLFVENGNDFNIVKDIQPTIYSNQPEFNIILQLNRDKTEIIESYNGITLIKNKFNITSEKLNKIINEQKIFNDTFFIKINNCTPELLEKYQKNNNDIMLVRTNPKSKRVKQTNIQTNEEIIYKSITESSIKFGSTEKYINDAIKNNKTLNGYKFEICH